MSVWNNLLPAWWPFGGNTSTEEYPSPPNPLNPARPDDYFVPYGFGQYERYGMATVEDVRIALKLCSPLPAIVSQKAFAFTKGTITVWNPESEKPVRGQYKEWENLFRQPNPFQSSRQFFIQAYSYQQHYGQSIIDPTYPAGYVDRPSQLRVLPNWLVEFDWYGVKYGDRPKRAWFVSNGIREELDVKRLIFIKDPASVDFDEHGMPLSRAANLGGEISNIISAIDARGQMITDRGAMGIISNTSKDVLGPVDSPEEQARLEQAFDRFGITSKRRKIIITNAQLGFTPMTFDVDQLGLHPEHIACVKSLCNTYGFPFTALAEGFEGKYNNSSNGRRDFQDTTIDPESMDFFEQLSLGLGMYKQRCEAYMDYSGVASVQASQEEKGKGEQAMSTALQTQWDLGIVTRNDIREKLGQERLINPVFDKYKWELTPEESGAIVEPENTNSNGTGNEED